VLSVAFSPIGQLLASWADDKAVILFDPTTGRKACTMKGHTSWVCSVA
jgi:WD40 repeat protein